MRMIDKSKRNTYGIGLTKKNLGLTSESRLSRSVVCQAISDLYMGKKKDKMRGIEWWGIDDFIACCDFACINPENLQKFIQEIILSKPYTDVELGDKLKRFIKIY